MSCQSVCVCHGDLTFIIYVTAYALATVASFLSMNQMMMKIVRIVRSLRMFVCRATSTEIVVDMGGVVVDDDNHPAGLGRFFYWRT